MPDQLIESMDITLRGENGEEITCDVLFTFENEETRQSYIVYTDYSLDDEGCTRIYSNRYVIENDQVAFEPVETAAEQEKISEMLTEYFKQCEEITD